MLHVQNEWGVGGYLLLHCEVARALWNAIFSRFSLSWVMPLRVVKKKKKKKEKRKKRKEMGIAVHIS
jgi:hypothetical protein